MNTGNKPSPGSLLSLLTQCECPAQNQAIRGCTGHMGIGPDSSLSDGELTAQGTVELRVEHPFDLLVITVDRKADQPIENLHDSVLHMYDEIASRGTGIHRGGRGTNDQTIPVDVRSDAKIIAHGAHADILGGEAAVNWHVAKTSAKLRQRGRWNLDV